MFTREDDRDRAGGAADLAGEQRSDADSARALDHELRALEQDDRLADRLVVDVHQVVEDVVEDRHGQVARLLHEDAVGDREARKAGLDAHDPEVGPQVTEGDRDPDASPPPPTGMTTVSAPLLPLEPDRSLAAMTSGSSNGWMKVAPRASTSAIAAAIAFEPLSLEDQLGSVGAAGLDLRHRRVLWDEDPRLDAGLARRPRDRLAVVAGARCDHAGLTFGVGEEREPVHSATHLERAGALEVLGLEPDLPADDAREGLGAVDRRLAGDAGDPLASVADVSCGRGCFRQLQP